MFEELYAEYVDKNHHVYTVEYDLLETERKKLYYLVSIYGLNNPRVLRQSRIIDNIILSRMKKKN